jgi:hypothetical protein
MARKVVHCEITSLVEAVPCAVFKLDQLPIVSVKHHCIRARRKPANPKEEGICGLLVR